MHCLICRVGERACALPMAHVREVMRPLAIERIQPAPEYLLGLAIIRGESVPVLDARMLLEARLGAPARWVVLRVGERRVALAVAAVVGARVLEPSELERLPPLLGGSREVVQALAILDGELLEVLEGARLAELGVRTSAEGLAP